MPFLTNLMKFTALFAGLASAAPNPLEKRTPGGVYMCTGYNWGGYCSYNVYNLNECITLQGTPYFDNTESFGPDEGTICYFWSNPDCSGNSDGYLEYPGSGGLDGIDQYAVGSTLQSFECWNN